MNSAFEQFQIATGLIAEGSRAAAAMHLRAALRALDKARSPRDAALRAELHADITALLAHVERNARAAA